MQNTWISLKSEHVFLSLLNLLPWGQVVERSCEDKIWKFILKIMIISMQTRLFVFIWFSDNEIASIYFANIGLTLPLTSFIILLTYLNYMFYTRSSKIIQVPVLYMLMLSVERWERHSPPIEAWHVAVFCFFIM